MKFQFKSIALGIVLAYIPVAALIAFLFFGQNYQPTFREQTLPSGKTVKISMCLLAWGIDHDDRTPEKDTFLLEYVSTSPQMSAEAVDQETQEVFELIRPVSEQWGFSKAQVSTFPTTKRKGPYFIYNFSRNSEGRWSFERETSKVFIND